MNKKNSGLLNISALLITSFMSALLISSCNNNDNSNNDSSNSFTSELENSTSSHQEENSSTSSTEGKFVQIDDVSKLFETYETDSDYNYVVDFKYDVVQSREYIGGDEKEYMYDGHNLQIDFAYDNSHYVDYLVYDNDKESWVYYLDDGSQKDYQYLDEENKYFFQYYSTVDRFELASSNENGDVLIDWEGNFVYDLENKKCKPVDSEALTYVCKQIFGDNSNEYWEKLEISWADNYITHVNAVSILDEQVYYFDISLTDHGYATVDVSNIESQPYVNPNQPYFKDRETYTGGKLSEAQAAVFTNLFATTKDMNYTSSIKWTLVQNGKIYEENSITNTLKAVNGNYEYSYKNKNTSLPNYDYIIDNASSLGGANYYLDDGTQKKYTLFGYGMDNYDAYMTQFRFDRILLLNINPEDLIYDEEKGYITAKDADTEASLCTALFQYSENYAGLRIYLKENDDHTYSIDKILTSAYVQSDSSIVSVIKEYTITDINNTSITLPEGVY